MVDTCRFFLDMANYCYKLGSPTSNSLYIQFVLQTADNFSSQCNDAVSNRYTQTQFTQTLMQSVSALAEPAHDPELTARGLLTTSSYNHLTSLHPSATAALPWTGPPSSRTHCEQDTRAGSLPTASCDLHNGFTKYSLTLPFISQQPYQRSTIQIAVITAANSLTTIIPLTLYLDFV